MYKRPTDEEMNKLEKIVSDFMTENFVSNTNSVDITKVCNDLGFKVLSLDLSGLVAEDIESVDGIILVDGEKKFIGVNNLFNPQDARFIIAHELAHYIYETIEQKQQGSVRQQIAFKDKFSQGREKPKIENMMDYMAAAILLPRNFFKSLLGIKNIKGIKTIDDAKKVDADFTQDCMRMFNVSEDLVLRRIVEVS